MINQSEFSSYLPKIQTKYKDIVRTNKGRKEFTPPFGYIRHPKDRELYQPDYEKLYALEKAIELIEAGATYRDTAKWLQQVIGEYVSHVFLYYEKKRRDIAYEKTRKGYKPGKLSIKVQEKLLDEAKRRATSTLEEGQG